MTSCGEGKGVLWQGWDTLRRGEEPGDEVRYKLGGTDEGRKPQRRESCGVLHYRGREILPVSGLRVSSQATKRGAGLFQGMQEPCSSSPVLLHGASAALHQDGSR